MGEPGDFNGRLRIKILRRSVDQSHHADRLYLEAYSNICLKWKIEHSPDI